MSIFLPSFISADLVSHRVLASFSVFNTIKSSPDFAAPLIPKISTGVEGVASLTLSPLSLIKSSYLSPLQSTNKIITFF